MFNKKNKTIKPNYLVEVRLKKVNGSRSKIIRKISNPFKSIRDSEGVGFYNNCNHFFNWLQKDDDFSDEEWKEILKGMEATLKT